MNHIELKVKAYLENIAIVRVAVASLISNLDITIDELVDIKTAVSEAVTNAIEHGYCGENESKYVNINIYLDIENENFEIIVEDEGIGIEDIALATTPTYTSKPELEHAGMGFTIMETFMDEVIVDSVKSEGTKITLRKKLKTKRTNIINSN